MSKKVILVGAAGRMGQTLTRLLLARAEPDLELVGAVERPESPGVGQDVGRWAGGAEIGVNISSNLSTVLPDGDVVIEFSSPEATATHVGVVAEAGKAMVIGTTGLDAAQRAKVQAAAARIPIVMAPNMSLGVNLLLALTEQVARTLRERDFDVEIVERHHRRKKDAPSGTALALGEAAAKGFGWDLASVAVYGRQGLVGERPAKQIGFHAVRGGDLVGDHTVLFAAEGECIELSHRATNREAFARGALRAASWVVNRSPKLYTMRDVLGL